MGGSKNCPSLTLKLEVLLLGTRLLGELAWGGFGPQILEWVFPEIFFTEMMGPSLPGGLLKLPLPVALVGEGRGTQRAE